MSLRCLFAASEVAGFAKTGGLADVAASLPRALSDLGVDCAVFAPLYRSVRQSHLPLDYTGSSLHVRMGDRTVNARLFRSHLPGSSIPVFLLEQPELYERDDPRQGRGIYQYTLPDGRKVDYADNCLRFGFFSRAVLEAIALLDFKPDIIHGNDWQTGMTPVYLKEIYRHGPEKHAYQRIKTLFTIHNLAYQGLFWHLDMHLLGLPWRLFHWEALEFHGMINFLKAGLVYSDLLTTVSPTYAREIQTPYYGCGLQGVLMQRASRLVGIVNGVDYSAWNPETDPHLARAYSPDTVTEGKRVCKQDLQQNLGIDADAAAPLLGMVSRLADQKGLDLVCECAAGFIQQGAQLAVLGEGDGKYHRLLQELRQRFPQRMGLLLKVDERMAHQVEAGADIFLMPSQYEPCGLNQLYSLKYGTAPVVRATGGLADTVVNATSENVASGRATGFAFIPYSAAAFREAVERALNMWRHHPEQWAALLQTGMRQDWSWAQSGRKYLDLYERLLRE